MSYVVIDADNLTIVGKHVHYNEIVMTEETVLANRSDPAIVCDIQSGASWSQLTELEAGMLCKNLGIEYQMQDYVGNLKRIREYAEALPMTVFTPEQIQLFQKPRMELEGRYGSDKPKPYMTHAIPVTTNRSKPSGVSNPRPPSSKGATGRVWAIADEVRASNPTLDTKALRKEVIAACVAAGIHEATSATQWSKWKKDKGL